MLKGKQLILATKPYTSEIRSKSWQVTLSTLTLLLISLAGSIFLPFILLRICSSILAGLLLVRMFIIYHDYQHHTILHRSKIAEVIMTVFGIYMLAPASIWKRSHDHHHQNNSKLFGASIGSFPVATKEKFANFSKADKLKYLAIRHPVTIILGYFTMFIVGMCYRSFTKSPSKHWDSLVALIIHVTAAICIFIFFGWQVWLLSFFVPFLIAFALGSYLFYAQHNFPGVIFSTNANWAYEKAALESSSYLKMHPVMAWFTANIGYHHIHHLNSRIPFYRLPEVMKDLPELQKCKTTTLHPKDVIACLRLKVWDPVNQEMVGVSIS